MAAGVSGGVGGSLRDVNDVYISAFNCSDNNAEVVFVRKGMKCRCSSHTGNSTMRFMPLS